MEIVRHKILVPAEAAKLSDLRQYLSELCSEEGIPPKTTRRMVLAIDEALANVIEHADLQDGEKEIELALEIRGDKIVAEICDRGIPFDPTPRSEGPDRQTYPRRGFGLYLIHMIVDRITYERSSSGQNVLTLMKRIE